MIRCSGVRLVRREKKDPHKANYTLSQQPVIPSNVTCINGEHQGRKEVKGLEKRKNHSQGVAVKCGESGRLPQEQLQLFQKRSREAREETLTRSRPCPSNLLQVLPFLPSRPLPIPKSLESGDFFRCHTVRCSVTGSIAECRSFAPRVRAGGGCGRTKAPAFVPVGRWRTSPRRRVGVGKASDADKGAEMPPSPLLRRSPGIELRKGSSHTRGQSFESGLLLKAKDDDLVLFHEMQKHETDNFLLHMSDDFDDSITKFGYTSDLKLGITIPAEGEGSGLLDIDGDKNDYDWLLTPPDTPLFPSLDDESQPLNTSWGRIRSQPILISRPYTNEKTQRTSRSSASPKRLSLSPQSSYGVVQPSARPSSPPHYSSSPVIRQTTPSQRSSTPTKPSTLTPRSSTPTLQRMSSGLSGQTSTSGRRGTSPVNMNRGHSASPKLRGWQSNSFPIIDAPPNFRTSLPDRLSSRVRGSSPASGNSMVSSSKVGRRSMSPSASTKARSSHNHESHQFTSCNKASLASSGDDGVDSVLSVGLSGNAAVRKYGASANSKAITSYRKPSSFPSSGSGPRRSLDSAVRQIDHQKIPQNMFRPLLSSVPATTFYVGKTTHETTFSRSLSQFTNHNASTINDLNYAADVEDSDHAQSDLAGESEKIKDSKTQEVPMSNFDEISEDNCYHALSGKLRGGTKGFDQGMNKEDDVQELESSAGETALQSSDIAPCSGIGSYVACLICGKHFLIIDVDGYKDICQECAATDKLLDSRGQRGDPDKATDVTGNDSLDSPDSKVHLQMGMAEHPDKNQSEFLLGKHQCNCKQDVNLFPDNCPPQIAIDVGLEHLPEQVMNSLINVGDQRLREQLMNSLDGESPKEATGRYIPQLSNPTAYSSLTFDIAEGTGISALVMKRSSSIKWPAVQRRAYSATSIICSDPSYSRDNFSGMKCNTGRESSSASSSIDLGSSAQTVASRKTDICVLRQSSRRMDEVDTLKINYSMNAESNDSQSEASVSVTAASANLHSKYEKILCRIMKSVYNEDIQEASLDTANHVNTYEDTNLSHAENASIEKAFIGQDTSCAPILDPEFCFQLHDATIQDNLNDDNSTLSRKTNEVVFRNDRVGILDLELEVPITTPDCSSIEDNHMLNDIGCQDDILDAASNSSSNLLLEQQIEHCFQDAQNEHAHGETPTYMDGLQEPHAKVEAPRRSMQRTFTLEEATDTVLFCSSIVHDLAYKAAAIGMEKEMAASEASHPTVTRLAKSISYQMDFQNTSNKCVKNSRKVKRKRLEIDTKKPSMDLGNDDNYPELVSSSAEDLQMIDSMKPPKLESKCNCTVM
ncbi:unnamed protein product [Musa banksii]